MRYWIDHVPFRIFLATSLLWTFYQPKARYSISRCVSQAYALPTPDINPTKTASSFADSFSPKRSPRWRPNFKITFRINLLAPKDDYSGHTAPLTSKCCILYIYSTNIGTVYFKHDVNAPYFPLQNAVCFIILTDLFPVLFTFYTQSVLKFKKK